MNVFFQQNERGRPESSISWFFRDRLVMGGRFFGDNTGGFFYVVIPVGVGVLIMLVVALIVNNLATSRKYPEFWF